MLAPVAQKDVGEDAVTQPNLSIAQARDQKPVIIDQDHLGRMTLGDRSLEREVLEIFARQTMLTAARITGAAPARAAAAAHTLKGSALGVGAWRVAQAAERLEQVASGICDARAMTAAMAELEAASIEARSEIAARLGVLLDEVSDQDGSQPRGH
jgi:HPt (histidine-containing phosphotransfer) domain-containing protein